MDLARAQGTAFTYQGKLTDDCCPATGFYDLTFKVFDNVGPGTTGQQGSTVALTRVPVTNGLFTRSLELRQHGNASVNVLTITGGADMAEPSRCQTMTFQWALPL